jgi:hypothetical protein
MPKNQRYSIGNRIENKLLNLIELAYFTYFITDRDKKISGVNKCILTLDIIKFLVHTSWEGKFISHNQYEEAGLKLKEIGRMFGGWRKNLENPEKKNLTQTK